MNWLIVAAGVLYLAGAWKDLANGDWQLAGAFVCYALANFFLAVR